MLIRLRTCITLQQGTFTAVIAPEPVILSALNDNPDLGRFLFLFLCGNSSRILPRIYRTSSNFDIRRPFTADQLLTALKEAGHTVIFIEHDPMLFYGADRLPALVAAALRDAGREALLILYSPIMDRSLDLIRVSVGRACIPWGVGGTKRSCVWGVRRSITRMCAGLKNQQKYMLCRYRDCRPIPPRLLPHIYQSTVYRTVGSIKKKVSG